MKKFRLPLLAIVLASLGAVSAQAQSTIVLSPERGAHTATRLNSGKVLITGGVNPKRQATGLLMKGTVLIPGGYIGPASDLAEIYNPATQSFTVLAATMLVPRANHAMTLLLNGTVLITGGFSGTSPHDEVEIY